MHTQPANPSPQDWMNDLTQEAHALVSDLESHPAARRLFEGRIDTDGYAHYLAQTYHYVRWTTPLLTRSGERMVRSGRHVQLGELLMGKALEERGHERWLLEDLAHLGWSAERVEHLEPCPAVRAYVAWNHYTSSCGVPWAFLGTAYVLEFLSVRRAHQTVEHLLEARAIPNIHEAVTFLNGHGSVDGDHVAEMESRLRSLEDENERAALLLSARITRALYPGLFASEPGDRLLPSVP